MARGKTRKQRGGDNNNRRAFAPMAPRGVSKSLPFTRKTGARNLLRNNQREVSINRVNTVAQPLYATTVSQNKRPVPLRAVQRFPEVKTNIVRAVPGIKGQQASRSRSPSPTRVQSSMTNFIGETYNVHSLEQPTLSEEITVGGDYRPAYSNRGNRRQNRRGLGSGFKVSWTRHTCRRMPKSTKDKAAYKKWLAGRSIGFTERSHLKALGVIPRANGTCKVSPKYR